MKNKIRLAIVDDHSLMREGLAKILQMESGFEVVKKASDGMELVSELERKKRSMSCFSISIFRRSAGSKCSRRSANQERISRSSC